MAENIKKLDLRARIQQLRAKYAQDANVGKEISSLENELYLVDLNELNESQPEAKSQNPIEMLACIGFVKSYDIDNAIKELIIYKDDKDMPSKEDVNNLLIDKNLINVLKEKIEANNEIFKNDPSLKHAYNNYIADLESEKSEIDPDNIQFNIENTLANIREQAFKTKPIDRNSPFYIEPPNPPMWPTEKD